MDYGQFLALSQEHLRRSQQWLEATYKWGHRDLSFAVGDWLWLKQHPYRYLFVQQ